MRKRSLTLAAILVLSTLVAIPSHAAPAAGVDAANNLIRFDTASPTVITSTTPITGLTGGDTIFAIDFRPATGVLTALATSGRLYTINFATGAAVLVTTVATPLSGTLFGADFNPTVDRFRITSDADQNLRVNPDTGAVSVTAPATNSDLALQYAATDVNVGMNPNVYASAYTNSFAGATTTTLFGIDTTLDILVTQAPPNNGTLNTIGPLGINATGAASFDIDPNGNVAYAALITGANTAIYTINTTTGAATLVGNVGAGTVLNGFAIVPAAAISAIPLLSPKILLLLGAVLAAIGALTIAKGR